MATETQPTPSYRRILLKVSGEALMGDGDYGIDRDTVDRIAAEGLRLGRRELGRAESRVAGPKGNREIFLRLSARAVDGEPGC